MYTISIITNAPYNRSHALREGVLKSSLVTAFVDGKRKIMYSDFLLYVSKAFLFGLHESVIAVVA